MTESQARKQTRPAEDLLDEDDMPIRKRACLEVVAPPTRPYKWKAHRNVGLLLADAIPASDDKPGSWQQKQYLSVTLCLPFTRAGLDDAVSIYTDTTRKQIKLRGPITVRTSSFNLPFTEDDMLAIQAGVAHNLAFDHDRVYGDIWDRILSYLPNYQAWVRVRQVSKRFAYHARSPVVMRAIATKMYYDKYVRNMVEHALADSILARNFCPFGRTKRVCTSCDECQGGYEISKILRDPSSRDFASMYSCVVFVVENCCIADIYQQICDVFKQSRKNHLHDCMAAQSIFDEHITHDVRVYWLCLATLLTREKCEGQKTWQRELCKYYIPHEKAGKAQRGGGTRSAAAFFEKIKSK